MNLNNVENENSESFATDFTRSSLSAGKPCEDPELGSDSLMVRVDSIHWSNEALFEDTMVRSSGLSKDLQQKWWDLLFEFCFSYSPSQPSRLELSKYLINNGFCDPILSSRSCSLGTIVHLAAETGSLEGLKYALSLDPKGLFLSTGIYSQTPLHCAAIREDEAVGDIIELLCKSGVNPNVLDKDGRSALFRATHPTACQALIKAGAMADLVCMNGARALGVFLYYGAFESAKILIEAGSNLNDYQTPNLSSINVAATPPKRTPFGLYVLGVEKNFEHKNALELFKSGANPFIVDPDGFCPFNIMHPKARAQIEASLLKDQILESPGEVQGATRSL